MTTITPDTKDWTWVLDRPCPECGLDTNSFAPPRVAPMIRENAAAWLEVLAAGDVVERPAPDVWSALEYGCHVRDVYRLFLVRLQLMLSEEGPSFANWDQDATAVTDKYGEQDPVTVGIDLEFAGHELADAFEGVVGDDWARTGARSDGVSFTVETFARYLIHDPVHHLHDVTQGNAKLAEAVAATLPR